MGIFSHDRKSSLLFLLFSIIVVVRITFATLDGTTESSNIEHLRGQSMLELSLDGQPSDEYRTALVMPCTFLDVITSLGMAMRSVVNGNEMPDETIVVFGIRYDLESALEEVLPLNLSPEIDDARAYLRHFVLNWVVPTEITERGIRQSRTLDRIPAGSSISPPDLLKSLKIQEWLDSLNKNRPTDFPWDDRPARERYFTNLTSILNETLTLDELAEQIPNFSIYLNRSDYPYAAENREFGMRHAFEEEPVARSNDIISFLDCDDLNSPSRVSVTKQIFRENEDIVQVIAGARKSDISGPYDEIWNNSRHKNAPEDMKFFLEPLDPTSDNPQFKESLYEKYFAFRDPEVKNKMIDKQNKEQFYVAKETDEIIPAPWDITKYNLKNNKNDNFSWWLGSTKHNNLSDYKLPYGLHNGHTSWRHSWLKDTIQHFPNSKRGQDSRLSYMSFKLGGRAIGTSLPLTTYVLPSGLVKRGAMEDVIDYLKHDVAEK